MSKTTKIVRILHLEDDESDADLIGRELSQTDPGCEVRTVASFPDYLAALDSADFDVILSDNRIPGIDGIEALKIARRRVPGVPFLFVSGAFGGADDVDARKAMGAADCVLKSELTKLAPAVTRALDQESRRSEVSTREQRYYHGMERLVTAVQELSLARDLDTVMAIVRRAARELTGADGATFVLRDNDMCFYAEEDAIAPLWKGLRFPMSACISGWTMLNRQEAVIEDIYADARIPHDAYRPTFVKSLAMVPIRTLEPLGAIGNYWAERHMPTPEEVRLLRALADTTAVALENVQVYAELERRVADRTAALAATNKELETFSYAVSHDLRAPLRHIDGFVKMLQEDCGESLNEEARDYLGRIRKATRRMGQLIEDLLSLSRTTQMPVNREKVDLSRLAREIASDLQAQETGRQVDFDVAAGLTADGDPRLLRAVFENLLSNAWKFTSKNPHARIEVGATDAPEGGTAYYVRDNGAGFDMAYAGRLFGVFERLHTEKDFPGTGVGLATVRRIIHKHGGRIWADAAVDRGAVFYFTLS